MIKQIISKFFQKASKRITTFRQESLGLEENEENIQNNPKEQTSNDAVKQKQNRLMFSILAGVLVLLVILIKITGNRQKVQKIEQTEEEEKVKVELASESIDGNKLWQNLFEDQLREKAEKLEERLRIAAEEAAEKEQRLQEERKKEIEKLEVQLKYAEQELKSAALELRRVSDMQEERKYQETAEAKSQGELKVTNLASEIEWDKPKSIRNYIPETSYVSGYLLGGMVVSTALNTPDENATPVVIRLSSRGNLPKNINVDISNCRILGSSYGDLSSERVIVRVEKLVCIDRKTELVTTSDIVGTIHGDDGMNGIKGTVVATSNRHIKNAFLGGIISGLASSSKGQEAMTLTSLGAVGTKRKDFKQLASEGALTGVSNAGEKIADYYLRLAEQMSPVLTVPSGVKVDVVFTKGFYLGELGVNKKIARLRNANKYVRGNEHE